MWTIVSMSILYVNKFVHSEDLHAKEKNPTIKNVAIKRYMSHLVLLINEIRKNKSLLELYIPIDLSTI
jgi:hypothetical protein